MQDLTVLEGKTIVELRDIAKMLGITPSNMKKQELLNKIVAVTSGDADAETHSVEPANDTPKRGRRPRMNGVKVGGAAEVQNRESIADEVTSPQQSEEETAPVESAEATPEPQRKRRGRKPKWLKQQELISPHPGGRAHSRSGGRPLVWSIPGRLPCARVVGP